MSSNWTQTYTGKAMEVLNPTPDMIDLEDIAHGLSNICRFTGQTLRFYSVAEHSVRVHDHCKKLYGRAERVLKWALLHDATEAYLVDFPRPLKKSPLFAPYRALEMQMEDTIIKALHLEVPSNGCEDVRFLVEHADGRLLATEKKHLMAPEPQSWGPLPDPIKIRWWDKMGWDPEKAKRKFNNRLKQLGLI